MRMFDVPIFPLNTVLFPQMVLPLHIFEQRYRLMISECLKNNSPFGVVLLQEGDEVQEREQSNPARPCAVGTLARITEVAKLDDGRMLLTTVGTERFRLMEYRTDKPFMTGDIEIWSDEPVEAGQVQEELAEIRALFQNYLKILMELAGKQIQGLEIPDEPDVLSYLIPNWLHISTQDKQKLLEVANPKERLQAELQILNQEIAFFEKLKVQAAEAENLEDDETDEVENLLDPKGAAYDISSHFSKN